MLPTQRTRKGGKGAASPASGGWRSPRVGPRADDRRLGGKAAGGRPPLRANKGKGGKRAASLGGGGDAGGWGGGGGPPDGGNHYRDHRRVDDDDSDVRRDDDDDSDSDTEDVHRIFVKHPDLDELRVAIDALSSRAGWGRIRYSVYPCRGGWQSMAHFEEVQDSVAGERAPSSSEAVDNMLQLTGRWAAELASRI